MWRADGDIECRTRYREMQVEIYGDALEIFELMEIARRYLTRELIGDSVKT